MKIVYLCTCVNTHTHVQYMHTLLTVDTAGTSYTNEDEVVKALVALSPTFWFLFKAYDYVLHYTGDISQLCSLKCFKCKWWFCELPHFWLKNVTLSAYCTVLQNAAEAVNRENVCSVCYYDDGHFQFTWANVEEQEGTFSALSRKLTEELVNIGLNCTPIFEDGTKEGFYFTMACPCHL